MQRKYEPLVIEPKWQTVWEKTRIYEVSEDPSKKKIYATSMLPYPSGVGMHVGHIRNYSINDAVARFYRQRGYNVMSNMGWDSFGLPAENFAIKTGTAPADSTRQNITNFKKQLKRTGLSFAWEREINTSDPDYYRWTQWLFLQFFEDKLAYQAENLQWWCTKCKTVLANEQVVAGKCWRHDDKEDPLVQKKRTNQWFFKITDFADPLLEQLENIDWPSAITSQQRNWIGRSEGAEVFFGVDGTDQSITVFTTRVDTIYGASFLVLAPEHPLVGQLTITGQKDEVDAYVSASVRRSDIERMDESRDKTGVFTGSYAVNPATEEKVSIWVSDFVLGGYGSGAIMAVPGHDQRDNQFAKKFDLPIVEVVESAEPVDGDVFTGEGLMKNSDRYTGMRSAKAREAILAELEQQQLAKGTVNYRMRDWLISRQRYWGAPIPIIHCQACGPVAVPEKDLPVLLPEIDNFEPTGEFSSVLAGVEEWVNVSCPSCDEPAKRETDTMDGYVCSSWYMYRYCDANNKKMAWDPDKVNYWFPVDFYFGGDHAVAHLLYFRFWNHYFARKGLIDAEKIEPVNKLVYNGYINAADGFKMSKSKGNVVDPLEVIDSGYGADALRMFELFVGPYDQDVKWNEGGVPGTYRFLQRVWTLVFEFMQLPDINAKDIDSEAATLLEVTVQRTIKRVTNDLTDMRFNTAVAALMELSNELYKIKDSEKGFEVSVATWRSVLGRFAQLLGPFAPHMAEELWDELGYNDTSIHVSGWPVWDESMIAESTFTMAVQVNGKVRGELTIALDAGEDEVVAAAKADEGVKKFLDAGELIKTIYVPQKILNFVVKTSFQSE